MVDFITTKHPVAFPSKVKSGICGHVFDVELKDDTLDNGTLIGLGDYIKLGTYKEAAATTFEGIIREKTSRSSATKTYHYIEVVNPGDSYFVSNSPESPFDGPGRLRAESAYYIAKPEMAKAYELAKKDMFEVSDDAIDGEIAEGAKVTVANKRIKVVE